MDVMTMVGLVIAFGGVIAGTVLQGGSLEVLLQPNAFLVVVLGSLGAALVASSGRDLAGALDGFGRLLFQERRDPRATLAELLDLARLARREGLLALEEHARNGVGHPFLARCLTSAMSGASADTVRESMRVDLRLAEQDGRAAARFWETWGSICPTIGVLGAVLGLIRVMHGTPSPDEIAPGIAVAFVSTVYGVGFANLVCLPIAYKLGRVLEDERLVEEMILEGVLGIQEGVSPGALRARLDAYVSPVAGPEAR